MNILAIGAHHDDIEFGCSGTLSRHVENNDQVHALVLSGGSRIHPQGDANTSPQQCRLTETKAAMELLGIDWQALDYQDTEIPFDQRIISTIEELIVDLEIQMVFTHWPGDTHQDHINATKATLAACRTLGNFLCYEQVPLARAVEDSPNANYSVDISGDHLKNKLAAASCHQSQIEKYASRGIDILEGLEVMSRYRGNQCGVKHAEAFHVVRLFR